MNIAINSRKLILYSKYVCTRQYILHFKIEIFRKIEKSKILQNNTFLKDIIKTNYGFITFNNCIIII